MKAFIHMSDAHERGKMRVLIEKLGWAWYGRYWAIVELAAKGASKNNPDFTLVNDLRAPIDHLWLAAHLNCPPDEFAISATVLADIHLIDRDLWKQSRQIRVPNIEKYLTKRLKRGSFEPMLRTSAKLAPFGAKDALLSEIDSSCPNKESPDKRKAKDKSLIFQDTDKEDDKDTDKVMGDVFAANAAKFFYDETKKNFPRLLTRKFDAVSARWIDAVEKLQRIDGYTRDEIRTVFLYVLKHNFWSRQIRATTKFRERDRQGDSYFSLMLTEANKNGAVVGKKEQKSELRRQIEEFHNAGHAADVLKRLQPDPTTPHNR
jgi:hypothetical protein